MNDNTQIFKALILDFGGVLFENKIDFDGPRGNLSRDTSLWAKARVGLADDEDVFASIARDFNVSPREVAEWLYSRRQPNADVIEIIKRLRPEIKVAIINNGLKTLFHGFIDRYGLSDSFDLLVNSAEEGIEKPNTRIYQLTCDRLKVKPQECVFIDDAQVNLDGATNVGMKSIMMTDKTSLEQELSIIGLTT